jgi:(1->4)-alpha-D-glucan 1-alpha-D-glucosylmutase
VPELWRRSLQRWRTVNRRWRKRIDDAAAPDSNEEYLLYQTLIGTWPVEHSGVAVNQVSSEYIERIQNYMAKALNEAKINTSWVQPNEAWLSAMRDFITKLLEPSDKNKFLALFRPVVEEVARLGAINSLTQTLLKLASPGVPDIYQGNEIWDFSLVDPDNRRPVDYKIRREMLDTLSKAEPQELMARWPDGRIKMFLTQRLLRFRREHADLFKYGSYVPLEVSGAFADCAVGFVRELAGRVIVVVGTRFASRVGFPPLGDKWQDTAVKLPEKLALGGARSIFSGCELPIQNGRLNLKDALSILPFAVVTNAL